GQYSEEVRNGQTPYKKAWAFIETLGLRYSLADYGRSRSPSPSPPYPRADGALYDRRGPLRYLRQCLLAGQRARNGARSRLLHRPLQLGAGVFYGRGAHRQITGPYLGLPDRTGAARGLLRHTVAPPGTGPRLRNSPWAALRSL